MPRNERQFRISFVYEWIVHGRWLDPVALLGFPHPGIPALDVSKNGDLIHAPTAIIGQDRAGVTVNVDYCTEKAHLPLSWTETGSNLLSDRIREYRSIIQ